MNKFIKKIYIYISQYYTQGYLVGTLVNGCGCATACGLVIIFDITLVTLNILPRTYLRRSTLSEVDIR